MYACTTWSSVHKINSIFVWIQPLQEPIEDVPEDEVFDLDQHGKLHVLSGGTKVVQHSPPLKSSAGLKGT